MGIPDYLKLEVKTNSISRLRVECPRENGHRLASIEKEFSYNTEDP